MKQLLIVLILVVPLTSSAQIWKNMGKKVEKKIESQASSRLERKIDKAIDKGFDKVEESTDNAVKSSGTPEKQSDPRATSAQKKSSAVTLSEVYRFKVGVSYSIQSEKQKPMEMTMWLGEHEAVGMSVSMQKDVFMLMQNEQMITFMQAQKKYMAMGSGFTKQILQAATEEAEKNPAKEEFSIKKIGSERILNYLCDVYEVKSTEYSSQLWLTQELGIATGNFMSAFSALTQNSGKFPAMQHAAEGLLLKMVSTQGKDQMKMEATAVHPEGLQFSTVGYTSLGL